MSQDDGGPSADLEFGVRPFVFWLMVVLGLPAIAFLLAIGVAGFVGSGNVSGGGAAAGFVVLGVISVLAGIACLLGIFRYRQRRLVAIGSRIYKRAGFFAVRDKLLIDLATVDEGHFNPSPHYLVVNRISFLSNGNPVSGVIKELSAYRIEDQKALHAYMSRYITMTGNWELGFGRSIES